MSTHIKIVYVAVFQTPPSCKSYQALEIVADYVEFLHMPNYLFDAKRQYFGRDICTSELEEFIPISSLG